MFNCSKLQIIPGLLQCSDGTILKPILKESQKREAEFYERITSSNRPDLVQLRKFMPKYYGVRKFTYNGFEQDYIMLEDLTDGMLEPCVMDLKIGGLGSSLEGLLYIYMLKDWLGVQIILRFKIYI